MSETTTPARAAELVQWARRMASDGLAVGTSGNLSVRDGDAVLCTPGGVAYETMRPADVVRVSSDGRVAAADGGTTSWQPTSELPMHRLAYAATGGSAVVHTHSPYATALACVLDELPAVHYTLAALGGRVPVVPYATFGSEELARGVGQALEGRSAVLLANHGALTVGASLPEAYGHAQTLEWCAALYLRARQLGQPRQIDDAELAHVAHRMHALGYLDEEPPALDG